MKRVQCGEPGCYICESPSWCAYCGADPAVDPYVDMVTHRTGCLACIRGNA